MSSLSACQVPGEKVSIASRSPPSTDERRAGARVGVALQAAHGDGGRAGPLRAGAPALLEVGLGPRPVGVGHAAHHPALAVEVLEVLELPVLRLRRLDPQHLAPVALPRDRAVGRLPVEAHRRRRAEPLGERAVVEPRVVAVGRQAQRQRAGERDPAQHRDPDARPQRQPLEPQEADRQRGDRAAEPERARRPDRGDRGDDEDQQRGEPDEREAARVGARPRGEQRGGGDEQRAAEPQRDVRPRVRAAVGERDAAQRLEPAPDARAQLVPVRQQPRVEPGDERGEDQPEERGERRAGHPHARRQRGGRAGHLAREHGGEHPRQPVEQPAALEHPRPLGHAQQREQGERDRARERCGQQRGGALVAATTSKDARTSTAAG